MAKQTISVCISTKGRAERLSECLQSLYLQSRRADEIVVIQNGKEGSQKTRRICDTFSKQMPIVFALETRIGLPFGRNKSIKLSRGDISAFIDDDCVAEVDWIKRINNHFNTYNSDGVIGYTKPYLTTNVFSCVEETYYYRWLLQQIDSVDRVCKLRSGAPIDFRNAAFKSQCIKAHRFNTELLLSCEDVELGIRLVNAPHNIYFDPAILVSHKNSDALFKLITRNFKSGYATESIIRQWHVSQSDIKKPFHTGRLRAYKRRVVARLENGLDKATYLTLFTVHPLSSKLGQWVFLLQHLWQ